MHSTKIVWFVSSLGVFVFLSALMSTVNPMKPGTMMPSSGVCSSGYALTPASSGAEAVLTNALWGGAPAKIRPGITGLLQSEWLAPLTGTIIKGSQVAAGALRLFPAPFQEDGVLHQHASATQPIPIPLVTSMVTRLAAATPALVVAADRTASDLANAQLLPFVQGSDVPNERSASQRQAASPNFLFIPAMIKPESVFLETFSGTPPAPAPWLPANWDVTVHSRSPHEPVNITPHDAEHGAQCEPAPAIHRIDRYADTVFLCRDHMMTALNDPEYGVIYLTPNRMVDLSRGTVVLTFDMSTRRTSLRDWIDLWITPYNDHLQLPLEDWLPDLNGPPRNAVHIRMDSFNGRTIFIGEVYKDFNAQTLNRASHVGYEELLTPSATRRDTFRLEISKTHIKFGMPAYDLWWVDQKIAGLQWDQGVVQIGHHSYTPEKDCAFSEPCHANTWHWDNLSFTNPVPFQIIQADKQIADETVGAVVRFSRPAPANAYLRFTGIGKALSVSFDGGKTWADARLQPQSKQVEEHYASYLTPMPPGVSQVWVKGQDWWGGAWHVRDLTIWSLTAE